MLKKREERLEGSEEKRQGAKPEDRKNRRDVRRPDPRPIFRRDGDFQQSRNNDGYY